MLDGERIASGCPASIEKSCSPAIFRSFRSFRSATRPAERDGADWKR